jgi:hypothetical protein
MKKILLISFICLLIYDFNILTPSSNKADIYDSKCIEKKNLKPDQTVDPLEQYYSDIFCDKDSVLVDNGIKTIEIDCTTEISEYADCYTVTEFSFVRLFLSLIFLWLTILFLSKKEFI